MRPITSASSTDRRAWRSVGDIAGIRRHGRGYIMPPTPAARHRPRSLAGQRRSHPGVGSGHPVPDAFRAVSRRPAAFPGHARASRRLEPDRAAADLESGPGRRPAAARVHRGGADRDQAQGRRGARPSSTAAPDASTIRGRACRGTGKRSSAPSKKSRKGVSHLPRKGASHLRVTSGLGGGRDPRVRLYLARSWYSPTRSVS